ncbi:alpha/beta-hydrolase [Meira miltonrushii]|uniref:Alpha/beta-hydrolase n=1 Tax=Meira miltonrushii TaxID=1280837 RepID=A0A316V851_9BASI|nr:alpha/beta-hydrolase [Meira miltonrushii]PWN32651.1 alpha/beta-hydrolase [Meira miltonrushii]
MMITKLKVSLIYLFALALAIVAHARLAQATSNVAEPSAGCEQCHSSLSFEGKQAEQYKVGNDIPTLPFRTKTSWAGMMPLTGPKITNASVFFWLWGQDATVSGEDLVIWLAGGPGCSAVMGGMMEQSGPFIYRNIRHYNTTVNPYSWTKVANVLYVENPVGVSLSVGDTDNISSEDAAIDFVSFLENFFATFPELCEKKLWLAGESWAGTMLPYAQAAILDKQPKHVPEVQGTLVISGLETTHNVSEDLVAYQYAKVNQKIMNLTDGDLAGVKDESDRCNLTSYLEQNLHYPPRGRLPGFSSNDCDPWEAGLNGNFDAYNIAAPEASNEDSQAYGAIPNFFRNETVQAYIHSPPKDDAKRCVRHMFYPDGDQSLAPDRSPDFNRPLLARMIERSKKYMLLACEYDYKIITNGTALALQNLTWNGSQGFSKPPLTPIFDVDKIQRGLATTERNLTFATIKGSGHFMGHDLPALSLAAITELIGKGDWTKK